MKKVILFTLILTSLIFSQANMIVHLSDGTRYEKMTHKIDSITFHKTTVVYDIDSNLYNTITIGNQEWITSNLRTTKLNDGTAIEKQSNPFAFRNTSLPAYCYYNNTTNIDTIKKHGALYNFHTINTANLAPEGWHVSTNTDWTILEDFLISTYGEFYAKSIATQTEWDTILTLNRIGNDPLSNNSSNFSAFPSGNIYSDSYINMGYSCFWWTNTDYGNGTAATQTLSSNSTNLTKFATEYCYGLSVRLVKD